MSALGSLLILAWAASSSAAAAQRVLLEDGGRPPVAARLRAELDTLGYEVVGAEGAPGAAEVRVRAEGVELWIEGGLRERVEAKDDGLLAIKSVELLRAYLHPLGLPAGPTAAPEAAQGPSYALMLGLRAAIGPETGVSPEALLRARITVGAHLSFGLDLEIPTLPQRISAAEGSASLRYGAALAAADLHLALGGEDRLRFGGGLGPMLLWIDGDAAPGFRGQAETLTLLAAELSLSYGRRVGPLWLWVELSGLVALPRPVVRFAGRAVADFGRPLIGGALLLELPL